MNFYGHLRRSVVRVESRSPRPQRSWRELGTHLARSKARAADIRGVGFVAAQPNQPMVAGGDTVSGLTAKPNTRCLQTQLAGAMLLGADIDYAVTGAAPSLANRTSTHSTDTAMTVANLNNGSLIGAWISQAEASSLFLSVSELHLPRNPEQQYRHSVWADRQHHRRRGAGLHPAVPRVDGGANP
jgi:hypothetical protein